MGGPIAVEWKGWESIGFPGVKHRHYVTSRQRILLGTGVTWVVGVSVDSSNYPITDFRIMVIPEAKAMLKQSNLVQLEDLTH